MIIVREVFTAKPGNASKLVKMFKESMKDWPSSGKTRFMTDLVGSYNTVIMETEYENMDAWQKDMEAIMNMPKPQGNDPMQGYTEMYQTGRREIYKIW